MLHEDPKTKFDIAACALETVQFFPACPVTAIE
jgi:hypothetical protein